MVLLESPPKLQDLSFHTIIRIIWQSSRLPSFLVVNLSRYFKRYDTYPYIEPVSSEHSSVICKLQDEILDLNLPCYWTYRLAIGLHGVDRRIGKFAAEMIANLQKYLLENVEICCRNISLDQENNVSKGQSLLNVLYDQCFRVFFRKHFLANHCVSPRVLFQLSGSVVEHKISSMKYEDFEIMYKNLSKLYDVDNYWIISWIKSVDAGDYSGNFSLFQYVVASRNIAAVKHFLRTMSDEVKQLEIVNSLKYLFSSGVNNANILIFFHECLNKKSWKEILSRNFMMIFQNLIRSWRHRHMIVPFYKSAISHVTFAEFKTMLLQCLSFSSRNHLDYYDIVNHVLLKFWYFSPLEYRKQPEIINEIIPELINLQYDFKAFSFLISDYDLTIRKRAFAQIVHHLVSVGNESYIDKLADELIDNDLLDVEDCIELLDERSVKIFFINFIENRKSAEYIMSAYKNVVQFAFKTRIDSDIFKYTAFNDKDFIIGLCHRLSSNLVDYNLSYDLIPLLLDWMFDNEKDKIEKLKEVMVSEKLVEDIYKPILLDVNGVNVSNINYNFFELQGVHSKTQCLEDKTFVNELLAKLLTHNNYELLSIYAKHIFDSDDEMRTDIEYFFESKEGLKAVLEFVTYLDGVDLDSLSKANFVKRLILYQKFKYTWLKTHDLSLKLNDILEEYGHPNKKNKEFKLKGRYDLNEFEKIIASRYVDVSYRIFRAVIVGNFSDEYLEQFYDEENIVRASLVLASYAGVDIEVIE